YHSYHLGAHRVRIICEYRSRSDKDILSNYCKRRDIDRAFNSGVIPYLDFIVYMSKGPYHDIVTDLRFCSDISKVPYLDILADLSILGHIVCYARWRSIVVAHCFRDATDFLAL